MTQEHIKNKIVDRLEFIFDPAFNLEGKVHMVAQNIMQSSAKEVHNEVTKQKLTKMSKKDLFDAVLADHYINELLGNRDKKIE